MEMPTRDSILKRTGDYMTSSILLVLCSLAFAQSKVQDHADVKASIRLYEAWLDGQMNYRGLPGVAVGVVYDRDLIWARGFGYADVSRKIPVTARTPFRMASHTKLFTAIAVMQLRDQGKLRLDDAVSKHLPWFQVRPAEEDDPAVTIEQLLTHRSGLPREAAAPYWTTFQFPTGEEVRRLIRAQQAAYSPDVRWKYSNLAFTLAGMIVETVSGESWQSYVHKHILGPLGMNDSTIDKDLPNLAVGYGRRMPDGSRKPMAFMDTKGIAPAAGLTSTLEDMAKFVGAQFGASKEGSKPILSRATLREMHRVRMLENDWRRGNGLGFAVNRINDKVYVGHGGSLAGYKTHTLIHIADRVGVIVLTNGDDSRPSQLAERLMLTVGEAVAKAAKPAKQEPRWDPSWSRFAGLYRSLWSDVEVVELDKRLVMIDPSVDDPSEQQKLEPQTGGEFRLEAQSGGAAVGERVRFVEQNGKVVRMHAGQSLLERVR